jgi:hypothetical protein
MHDRVLSFYVNLELLCSCSSSGLDRNFFRQFHVSPGNCRIGCHPVNPVGVRIPPVNFSSLVGHRKNLHTGRNQCRSAINPMSAARTTLSTLGHNSGDNGRLNCPAPRPHCDMPALRQMNNSSSSHLSPT